MPAYIVLKDKNLFSRTKIFRAVIEQTPRLAAKLRDELFKKRDTEGDDAAEHQGFLILSHDYNLLYGNETGLHWLHTFQAFEQIHDKATMPRPFRALGAKLLYGSIDQTAGKHDENAYGAVPLSSSISISAGQPGRKRLS
ncbi:hypothetical protein R0I01_11975 [Bacillus pumilus]|nr:hypothetical protein R0I01_11975 [Bacillus pumilus]